MSPLDVIFGLALAKYAAAQVIIGEFAQIQGTFDFSVRPIQNVVTKESFGPVALPTQVAVMEFDLTAHEKSLYQMHVDQCWGSPTVSSSGTPQYHLLTTKGCLVSSAYVSHTPGQWPYRLETASFAFVNTPVAEVYFHCKVSICRRDTVDPRCQPNCPKQEISSGVIDAKPRLETRASTLGRLYCAPTGFRYRVTHDEIFAAVQLASPQKGNVTVKTVGAGTAANPVTACLALKQTSAATGAYQELDITYGNCGEVRADGTDTFAYSGSVTIDIMMRVLENGYAVFRNFRLRQAYLCEGGRQAQTMTSSLMPVPILEVGQIAGGGTFSVELKASQRSGIQSSFGALNVEVQVVTLEFDLFDVDKSFYKVLADECWATVDPSRYSQPQYRFLQSQGCVLDPGFVQQTAGTLPYRLQLAAFQFEGTPMSQMFLHCNVNICRIQSSDRRCTPTCSPRQTVQRSRPAAQTARYIKATVEVDSDVKPRVQIRNGRPYRL